MNSINRPYKNFLLNTRGGLWFTKPMLDCEYCLECSVCLEQYADFKKRLVHLQMGKYQDLTVNWNNKRDAAAFVKLAHRLPHESIVRQNFRAIAISATRLRAKNSTERDDIETTYKYDENYFCHLLRCNSSLPEEYIHFMYDQSKEFTMASQLIYANSAIIAYETSEDDDDDTYSYSQIEDSNSLLDFDD